MIRCAASVTWCGRRAMSRTGQSWPFKSAFVVGPLLVLLGLPAALAQPAPADAELGKQLVRQGNALYQAGDFVEALKLYSKGYQLRPKPATLFNMAQCERQLGHHQRAIFLYGSYLRTAPADAPNRAQVAQLL